MAGFNRGVQGGILTVLFGFILRLASLAPFPPEAATEALISVIPASIEEPAVQQLGDLAGLLTLLGGSLFLVAVYGILGIIFEKYVDRDKRLGFLSRLEHALLLSIAVWLVVGLLFFPLTGYSIFGQSSAFASPDTIWIFPISLLISQLLFGLSISRGPTRLPQPARSSSEPHELIKKTPWTYVTRRAFIERSAILVSAVALGLVSAGALLSGLAESSAPGSGGTPIDLIDAPPIFSDPRLSSLVDSEVTTNSSFYRVAIDLFDPSVSSAYWSLALSGAVANPKKYSMTQLQALPSMDMYDTFLCVSNPVNGPLAGNAKWTGLKISDLIADAGGLLPGAQYIVFYSVDGYSVGLPVSKATAPDSILAYRMNDATLPVKHGYPLRAVIPGLYGMMSAKWINSIKVIDSVYDGYWQTRGWTNDATVNTQSFIMIPGDGSSVSLSANNGSVILGGVAYAGERGISKVEVSVDGGRTWTVAVLKNALSNVTWRLWALDWHPISNGTYNIYVRATDGAGSTQISAATDTFPNGATGYAVIQVNVTP